MSDNVSLARPCPRRIPRRHAVRRLKPKRRPRGSLAQAPWGGGADLLPLYSTPRGGQWRHGATHQSHVMCASRGVTIVFYFSGVSRGLAGLVMEKFTCARRPRSRPVHGSSDITRWSTATRCCRSGPRVACVSLTSRSACCRHAALPQIPPATFQRALRAQESDQIGQIILIALGPGCRDWARTGHARAGTRTGRMVTPGWAGWPDGDGW
jgi:hypothetical protein